MNTRTPQILRLAAGAVLAGFAFTGCITPSDTDPTADGGNAVIKEESDNMGTVLNTQVATKAAIVSDTVTAEIIKSPLQYNDTCQCFVRTAQVTVGNFERWRYDTISLFDSSGNKLGGAGDFHPGLAYKVTHIRHVTRLNDSTGRELDITFSTTLTRALEGDTVVYVWSGTVTGTFNGDVISATISNVKRPFLLGLFGFAMAGGNIEIRRGTWEITMEFDGAGQATCTISHNGSPVRTTHIDINGTETAG